MGTWQSLPGLERPWPHQRTQISGEPPSADLKEARPCTPYPRWGTQTLSGLHWPWEQVLSAFPCGTVTSATLLNKRNYLGSPVWLSCLTLPAAWGMILEPRMESQVGSLHGVCFSLSLCLCLSLSLSLSLCVCVCVCVSWINKQNL